MLALNSDIISENEIWKDIWEFRKKYYHGEDNDEYWQELVDSV